MLYLPVDTTMISTKNRGYCRVTSPRVQQRQFGRIIQQQTAHARRTTPQKTCKKCVENKYSHTSKYHSPLSV